MNNVIKLNENNDVNAVSDIAQYIANCGLSQRAVGRESGVSATALSQFLSGTYTGDNTEIARKLQIWIDNRETKTASLAEPPAFIKTKTAQKIWSSLQYAQIAQRITVIYGNSGVGKTAALREFAKARPNVWLITATPSTATLLECLYDIAVAIGAGDLPRRGGSLSRIIKQRLAGTNGLLIIDEADHLPYEVLEELRLIQEITGVGLALCGNHQIYAKLSGGGSRRVDFARLFSRIAKKTAILETLREDIATIASAWGLTDSAERDLVFGLSEKPGAIRTVTTTLALAGMLARGNNEQLNASHIRAAIADLGGA